MNMVTMMVNMTMVVVMMTDVVAAGDDDDDALALAPFPECRSYYTVPFFPPPTVSSQPSVHVGPDPEEPGRARDRPDDSLHGRGRPAW